MNKKIVIVGAGASGIAAATKLISNGFRNIVILEAENRIGGRVNTIRAGDNVLDMGAQWCHGEKGNVVYDMAKDKNLLETHMASYKSFNFVRSNGDIIPMGISDKLSKVAMEIVDGNSYEDEKKDYDGSLGNFFAERYKDELLKTEYNDIDAELREQAYDFYSKMQNSIDASDDWYQTSCRSLLEYRECEGDQLLTWKDKGYITVFDLLQNKIPTKKDAKDVIDILPFIHFGKEVRHIVYNQRMCVDGAVRIECADGSAYSTDHIICTVSLGVLKEQHLTMFQPLLPDWKIRTIDGLMIGTVDKIYMEFETAFWPEDWNGFCLLWKPEQLKSIREDPINGEWIDGLIGFFPINNQPNILCGWVTGPKARLMEQINDADVKAGVENIFRMFLKTWNVPDAKSMIRSKWYSNPHFRGSYTNYSLKSDALGATTSKLAQPINDQNGHPILQFAGEATDLRHYSTVHGAIQSGWREAQRLIDLYRPTAQL